MDLGDSAGIAFGFVVGAVAGSALAARVAGRSVTAGRLCPHCRDSLSFWPRFPILSWVAVVPRCRRCGLATPRLHAFVEAAVILIGLAAIFATPFPEAIFVALAGWALLLLFLWRRRRIE